jgi:hypothetical protein
MSAFRPLNAILAVSLEYHNGNELVPEHRAGMPRLTQVRKFSELMPFTTRWESYAILLEDPSQDKNCPAFVEKKVAKVLTQFRNSEYFREYATPVELAASLRACREEYAPAQALDATVYRAVVGGFAAHVEHCRQAGYTVRTFAQKRIAISPPECAVRVKGLNKTLSAVSLEHIALSTPVRPADEQVF